MRDQLPYESTCDEQYHDQSGGDPVGPVEVVAVLVEDVRQGVLAQMETASETILHIVLLQIEVFLPE